MGNDHHSKKLKILVSGASGLVGSALTKFLESRGFSIARLVRRKPESPDEVFWDPETGILNRDSVEGFDAWINLSGENIAGSRWTDSFKQKIFASRISTTGLLVSTIKSLKTKPSVFISASAIGYYGDCSDRILTEDSEHGHDFLADVVRRWEEEALGAQDVTRVVMLRTGIVLSAQGGALKKMLLPFKLGLGGKIGSGSQFMSCIELSDLTRGIYHALITPTLLGPVNFATIEPTTNFEFTKTLGRVLKRPTLFAIPALIIEMIFGEMGKHLLLSSQRVSSNKLIASGFTPQFTSLDKALVEAVSSGS